MISIYANLFIFLYINEVNGPSKLERQTSLTFFCVDVDVNIKYNVCDVWCTEFIKKNISYRLLNWLKYILTYNGYDFRGYQVN